MDPRHAVAHLTPDHWARANRALVGKALAEFAHEALITPQPLASGRYAVTTDDGAGEYRFGAHRLALDHWQIDVDSITRHRDGAELPPDAVDLILELRDTLGISDQSLPTYLEEISSTLAGRAFRLGGPTISAAELAAADFQRIESQMSEGHPAFVANSGRLGFDAAEYHAYAPEAARPIRLLWLAAHRDCATFSSSAELNYRQLIDSELAAGTQRRFRDTMARIGLDLDDFLLIPAHPWQWYNRLAITFAGEIAGRRLVCLGEADDDYQAQQSIRTFFNLSAPSRHYVKTALSVLNMGFVRGLSAEYMAATPAINDWLADLIAGDELLKRLGFDILRERAAVGYHHAQFNRAAPKGSPHRKLLAALWRESPVPRLAAGERLATMASLLHVDPAGRPLVSALIAGSGCDAADWLRRYLAAYLTPILHCFYAYDLVFMPHGENVILVLDERGVPGRVLFKDIAEEIGVMSQTASLPPAVERVRVTVPEELKTLSLFTDVFDSFFRFLAALLHADGVLPQAQFWAAVAGCITDYQSSMPQLADRFRRYDLFVDEFPRSCLNRLQLRNNQRMVDLDDPDPASGLAIAGSLSNPIGAAHRY